MIPFWSELRETLFPSLAPRIEQADVCWTDDEVQYRLYVPMHGKGVEVDVDFLARVASSRKISSSCLFVPSTLLYLHHVCIYNHPWAASEA